ncbi:MAG: site-specific integrase [Gammaproteobacteria bacterium]|nr:site-specific integrase [Gammaproteobacteria bacterium]
MSQGPTPLFDSLNEMQRQPKPEIDLKFPADYAQAHEFLYSYRGSAATFNAYRREIERLLQWAWLKAKKSISNIRHIDIESYIEFCQSPPVAWIGSKQTSRFINHQGQRIPNANWRPFVTSVAKNQINQMPNSKNYQLSAKALQAIFAILSSFYNYLIQEDYINYNPVAQLRQKSKYLRKHQSTTVIRRLSELQWNYVLEAAEQMAEKDPLKHERTVFIMNALYAMYLRISELAATPRWQPQMGHFFKDSEENWWFRTVGKGNKQRDIAVSDAMLVALKRYRHSLGLTPTPAPGESMPLIPKLRGGSAVTSTRFIRMLVQTCFDAASSQLKADGFSEDAEQLQAATVHWLRHTGISDDIKHRPREHVRDDAGHSSSAITDKYIDVELRARHASSKSKKIRPDD